VNGTAHRARREMLGAFVLGQLESSAGSFVGTGGREMRCTSTPRCRADAAGFRVLGPYGAVVLDAAFG
jgi:hypothetical protein